MITSIFIYLSTILVAYAIANGIRKRKNEEIEEYILVLRMRNEELSKKKEEHEKLKRFNKANLRIIKTMEEERNELSFTIVQQDYFIRDYCHDRLQKYHKIIDNELLKKIEKKYLKDK